jgi:hypothetical protein
VGLYTLAKRAPNLLNRLELALGLEPDALDDEDALADFTLCVTIGVANFVEASAVAVKRSVDYSD